MQRTFVEDYRLRPDTDAWRVGEVSPDAETCVLELTEEKVLLPRELPLHDVPAVKPDEVIAHGELTVTAPLENPYRDRVLDNSRYTGYAIEEMAIVHSDEIQRFAYTPTADKRAYDGKTVLAEGSYETLALPREVLGYYTDMARITGTLWEHMNGEASGNHGFAAYAAHLLYYSIKKEEPPFKLNL